MDQLKELKEAKVAAAEVIKRIDYGISSLDSASSWGFLDILGGVGFSSIIKRSKINDANVSIAAIITSFENMNKELEDVNMCLPEEISNTVGDKFFDIWFDNIFTDIRVQGEIEDALHELRDLRENIKQLIRKLELAIKDLEK